MEECSSVDAEARGVRGTRSRHIGNVPCSCASALEAQSATKSAGKRALRGLMVSNSTSFLCVTCTESRAKPRPENRQLGLDSPARVLNPWIDGAVTRIYWCMRAFLPCKANAPLPTAHTPMHNLKGYLFTPRHLAPWCEGCTRVWRHCAR